MKLIDTHAHLDSNNYKEDVLRAKKEGIEYIINVGADVKSSQWSYTLSQEVSCIYATAGIHPHDADKVNMDTLSIIEGLASKDKVVAIGEIGLDYHYDNSPRDTQKEVFQLQLEMAREVNLPVVIHSREAVKDTMEILEKEKAENIGGIFHCFSEDVDTAQKIIDMGMYIAIGGVITFKNAGQLRKVVKKLPLDRLVVETDAPYLTPHPHRGHRNEPSYIKHVIDKIADIKNISTEKLAEITTANAKEVYGLPE